MPTIVAKRRSPRIKLFHGHLVTRGNPKLVALIASMKKLLTILIVMIRDRQT